MRRIILFTNIKGGVGKTSCCALFAQYLCENGYSVKVLDADIQAPPVVRSLRSICVRMVIP